MADEREVTIVIKGKNLTPEGFAAARKELAGLGDETEKVRQKTKPATDQTNLFSGAWKNLVGAFALGNIIADVVGSLASEVMGFVKNSQSITAVRASFEGLARTVGSTGAEMLAAMRAASRGVVSDFDLMLVANKAILLGLPVTASEMGRLTSAAITLGKAMGLDAKQSVDNLVTALSRSSPQILDNLGLKVDLEAATIAYAASLKKSVDQLTDAERSEAFYYGALKAADEAMLGLNSSTSEHATLTEKLGRVWTTTGNFITDIFADLNESIGRGTSSFGGFYDLVMSAIPGNAGYAAGLRDIRADADKAAEAQRAAAAATAKQNAEAAAAAPVYRDWSKELKDAETKVQALSSSQLKEIETAKKAGASQKDLTAQFGLGAVALKLVDERIKEEEAAQKKATAAREKSTAEVKKNEEAFHKLARQQAQTQEAERLIFLTKAMADAHVEMAKKAEETAAAERKLAAERAAVTNKAFTDSLGAAAQYGEQYLALITTQHEQELRAVETQRAAALKAIEPLRTQVPAQYEASRQQIMAIYDRMLADLEVHGQKQMGQWSRIASGIPSALVAGIASGNPATTVSNYLGGALFGDDGPLTQTFFRGLEKVGGGFPAGIYQGLANAIPGLGALAGPLIEKGLGFITGIVGKVFGSAGRDAVKEFAATMGGFDSLRTKLIPLGDEGERLWKNLTQGVGKNNPEQAQKAIDAITAALEKQAGVIASEAELLAGTKLSWKEAEELVKQYGIETTNSGKALEQAKLSEQSEQIAVNWRKMLLAGMDVKDVTTGMADEAQAFLDQAFKMGLEVPESMRPMLEKMAEMGLLTDASGNKMKDVSGIEFSTDPISRLVQKMDELLSKLFGIGDAAEDSNRKTKKALDNIGDEAGSVGERIHKALGGLKFEIPLTFGEMPDLPEWSGGGGSGGGKESGAEGFATGGMAVGPLRAYIEPGRKEIIGDISFMQDALVGAMQRMGGAGVVSASGSGGGPQVIHNHIYLDGIQIDERIIEVGERALQGQRWQVPATATSGRTRP